MKNSLTHSSKTRGKKELNIYAHRAANVRLDWCKQVISIIKNFEIGTINDLGCNYFQLYKEIKYQNNKYSYFGYDIDRVFISLGLKYFPGLKRNYKIGDIEKIKLRKADCTVLSGTLAHVDNPKKVLKNIFKSTKKIILIRDMFGLNDEEKISRYKTLRPVNYRQFSFENMAKIFKKNGYMPIFLLDEATNFSNYSKNKKYASKRKYYILLGLKNAH